ncbi:MAG: aminodeoxychorismate/anthranilate synthase component II [Planctomycetes bacterium]|nr:aminodeoxychorismate/anthranilate synthase component II [Planctomycetota bacterium]
MPPRARERARPAAGPLLVIDNYDSFTFNLVQPLRARGHDVRVVRNDALTVDEALALRPARVLLSPGPNRPEDAGVCVPLVRAAAALGLPVLGVCLGHQAIGVAFGARCVRARRPLHGRASRVAHDDAGVFRGLPSPLEAARYHSLCLSPRRLPAALVATAWADDGTLMGVRHASAPIEGVQFHPESFMTPLGERLLLNFVEH